MSAAMRPKNSDDPASRSARWPGCWAIGGRSVGPNADRLGRRWTTRVVRAIHRGLELASISSTPPTCVRHGAQRTGGLARRPGRAAKAGCDRTKSATPSTRRPGRSPWQRITGVHPAGLQGVAATAEHPTTSICTSSTWAIIPWRRRARCAITRRRCRQGKIRTLRVEHDDPQRRPRVRQGAHCRPPPARDERAGGPTGDDHPRRAVQPREHQPRTAGDGL